MCTEIQRPEEQATCQSKGSVYCAGRRSTPSGRPPRALLHRTQRMQAQSWLSKSRQVPQYDWNIPGVHSTVIPVLDCNRLSQERKGFCFPWRACETETALPHAVLTNALSLLRLQSFTVMFAGHSPGRQLCRTRAHMLSDLSSETQRNNGEV